MLNSFLMSYYARMSELEEDNELLAMALVRLQTNSGKVAVPADEVNKLTARRCKECEL